MSKNKHKKTGKLDRTNKIDNITKGILGEKLFMLIEKLKRKEYISEYVLAEELNKDINATRHLLYELLKYNLVSFRKEKDKVRGWYIYYWKFYNERLTEFIIKRLTDKMENYLERIEMENNHTYFMCPNKCVKLTFEQALNFNFKCPECGANLIENNRKEEIKRIEKVVGDINTKIMEVKKIKAINEKRVKGKKIEIKHVEKKIKKKRGKVRTKKKKKVLSKKKSLRIVKKKKKRKKLRKIKEKMKKRRVRKSKVKKNRVRIKKRIKPARKKQKIIKNVKVKRKRKNLISKIMRKIKEL